MNTVAEQADRALDALGNPIRRAIITLLRQSPLPVGSIAAALPISRPAVSKHLQILQEAGLVAYSEEGTRNIFYLRSVGFQAATAYLHQFWTEALINFQRLAEESDRSAR